MYISCMYFTFWLRLFISKYVSPPYCPPCCRAEMYAGRIACCPSWVTVCRRYR